MKKFFLPPFILLALILLTGCDANGNLNFFSIQDDIEFGQQLDAEILANPSEYPLLSRSAYPEVYAYVEGIMDLILQSDLIRYEDSFPWQVRIIDQDVLNAFAAPGGYLYFYTGFLSFAESEAELAGVMAHEIAHSDRRHSTENMTKVYGLQVLLSLLIGEEPGLLSEILAGLTVGASNLAFTRENEYEADEYALRYMNSVRSTREYELRAMQEFFNRVEDVYDEEGEGSTLGAFFRTHPYNDDREDAMDEIWEELGAYNGEYYRAAHEAVIAQLP
ncbi:peptidase M48 [Oceanispirochaeta crateris]|uniref:Peptidase M48 n=1 Tax=Oceanispirochaeta crateris TaxID=2518645 RepID=A0A5C1QJT4_9SPIO|nr:M48 family metalloprotease [Oceanispirochaeta crateris]QEN06776.1 peptidase M48 [Oceanispirochaeta crateris]